MRSSRSCSHCGRMCHVRPGEKCYCLECGHRGDVSRDQCDCPRCRASVRGSVSVWTREAAGRIQVAGRGFNHPVLYAEVDGNGVTIRIDDEQRPERWFEIRIPVRSLSRFLDATALAAIECAFRNDEPAEGEEGLKERK